MRLFSKNPCWPCETRLRDIMLSLQDCPHSFPLILIYLFIYLLLFISITYYPLSIAIVYRSMSGEITKAWSRCWLSPRLCTASWKWTCWLRTLQCLAELTTAVRTGRRSLILTATIWSQFCLLCIHWSLFCRLVGYLLHSCRTVCCGDTLGSLFEILCTLVPG